MCANLFCTYGASEAGTVCVGAAHLLAGRPGAVGFVTPDADVEITDEAGAILPTGQEGIVRVRTPQNVDHYVGDPERSKLAFRNGWFYPGDIGSLTADRMLLIQGREESVLNLSGDKIKPELVEDALVSFAGIEQAAAFVKADALGIAQLWAAIVAQGSIDETALRSHCERKLGAGFTPLYFIKVDMLPRNEMGKLQRNKLAALTNESRMRI
jgi:acyl-coenzyme A synthetase/AMP-(fatty) acid ligase